MVCTWAFAFKLNKRVRDALRKVISDSLVYLVEKKGGRPNLLVRRKHKPLKRLLRDVECDGNQASGHTTLFCSKIYIHFVLFAINCHRGIEWWELSRVPRDSKEEFIPKAIR